jgi:hypothetical protein
MPIMATRGRNDARSAAWLLANTALNCIDEPDGALEQKVELNNVYRLLEAYRVNAFLGLERGATMPNTQSLAEALTLLPVERHLKEVQLILEKARVTVFAAQSKDEAIKSLEEGLRGIVYPEEYEKPYENDRAKATRFFKEIINQLYLA